MNKLTIVISITGAEVQFPQVVTALINKLKFVHGETIFKHFLVLVMADVSISKVQRDLKPLFDLDMHQIMAFSPDQIQQVNAFLTSKKEDQTVQYTQEINMRQ